MDSKLLQTIIKITGQHDTDALDLSLVTSLAEIVPASEISVIQKIRDDISDKVREVLKLSMATINTDCNNHTIDDTQKTIIANSQIIDCMRTATVIKQTLDGLIYLYIPLKIDNKVTGVLKIESYENFPDMLTVIEGIIHIYCNLAGIFNESERDKLTRLLNRKTFDYKLDKLLDKQQKQQELYSIANQHDEKRHTCSTSFAWLAMLDIDRFKRINDTYGHLFGDEVILLISQQMKQFFRSSDLLFRFGGEEFVIILEPVPVEMARRTFDRFRETIARHVFPQVGNITVSIGYAKITKKDFSHVVLERADKALYYAKEHGRNSVYNFEELLESGAAEEKRKSGETIFFDSR